MSVTILQADITQVAVDAIVNAANSSLLGGGGVDGAIHRAAGPELLAECRQLRATTWPGGLPVGQAVATAAYQLPARWVIHTVGPNAHRGQTDPRLLEDCFRNSLILAQQLGATSIAFPAISAGVYGWPGLAVAEAAARVINSQEPAWPSVTDIRFVLFSDQLEQIFRQVFTQE
ncbi:MAG: O-acetyl-ADP-ribose deacetylase [Propionibacteriaceae bacterium]|jgi:O-acetyl-ADP-ribose deacetylase (regulator of RNase III)|nr:O-acetyl-ADP-ribose deacetylase [Propionibacteriaceae bacterium]